MKNKILSVQHKDINFYKSFTFLVSLPMSQVFIHIITIKYKYENANLVPNKIF